MESTVTITNATIAISFCDNGIGIVLPLDTCAICVSRGASVRGKHTHRSHRFHRFEQCALYLRGRAIVPLI